ncbi:MAG: RnfABCDGE type electron transport complex subunit B, partial [Spirochaetaceae bacterium]|nr:RnfABCDGE type electron transport complex subunit B [Spirochaetaceae bacterium]
MAFSKLPLKTEVFRGPLKEFLVTILYTVIVAFVLAFVLGVLLGIFKKFFSVPVDPTVEKIRAVLSGGNCGGCGFPGCDGFAAACAKGLAPVDGCTAGGAATAQKIAEIMGQSVS